MATKPTLALIPSGYGTNKVYSVLPSDGSGDFTFGRTGTATRINKDKLIESVGSNIPRIDYTDSGCPSLLLEPQRTNSVNYSQEIDNAYWFKSNCSIIANLGISPDGSLNADKLTTSVSVTGVIYRTGITTGSLSFFAKDVNLNTGKFRVSVDGVGSALWNKDGTLSQLSGSSTATDGISYGNGWLRFTLNVTSGSVVNYGIHDPTGSESILIYGVQNEPSSVFSSSYIPTTGTSVTRIAETANSSGNASTFNDSEGVLFAEISNSETTNGSYLGISNGGTSERLIIGNEGGFLRVYSDVNVDGNVQSANKDFNKIAVKYNSSNTSIYLNGFLIKSINQSANLSGINELKFNSGGSGQNFHGKAKQLQYFNTALTDLELETLTSFTTFNAMALNFNYTIY